MNEGSGHFGPPGSSGLPPTSMAHPAHIPINPAQMNPAQMNPAQMNPAQMKLEPMKPLQLNPAQMKMEPMNPAQQPLHPRPPPGPPGGVGMYGYAGPQALPALDPQAAAAMWAQDGYMGDSGIGSCAPSAAPSVMSGASSLHNGLCGSDLYSGPSTGPPTPYEGGGYPPYLTPQQQIHKAAFPRQALDPGGANPDVSVAIPELIRLLFDEDRDVVANAATLVSGLAKKQQNQLIMVDYPNLMSAVVQAMNKWPADQELLKDSCHILYHMSQQPKGLEAIFGSGGIAPLVRVLGSQERSLLYYSVTTLHNLTLHQPGGKEEARAAGLVPQLVACMSQSQEKFLAIAVDCLRILVFSHAPSKAALLACGGPARLVDTLRNHHYEKLLLATTKVLKAISVEPDNKAAIVKAGGLQALQLRLHHESHRFVVNSLYAIRNLSDVATKEDGLEPLLDDAVRLLGSGDPDITSLCAGILRNLPCNSERNKNFLVSRKAVPDLLRVLRVHVDVMRAPPSPAQRGKSEEIVVDVLSTLRHLTARHPSEQLARQQIRDWDLGEQAAGSGLRLLAVVIGLPSFQIIKEALGLVKNLARDAADPFFASLLEAADLIPAISSILQRAYMELYKLLQERQSQGGAVSSPEAEARHSDILDCLEASVAALGALVKEAPHNGVAVCNAANFDYLLNLLSTEEKKEARPLLRQTLGLLADLTEESRDAAAQLEDHLPRLNAYAALPIPAVQQAAVRCLHNANKFKSGAWGGGMGDGDAFSDALSDMFLQRADAESFDAQSSHQSPDDMDMG